MERVDVAIIGGGLVGLATARSVLQSRPAAQVVVVEKEPECGRHQSGHNSGVIHSGIYYPPGSLKARLCAAGSRSMLDFCTEHGIAHSVCGKMIVASNPGEIGGLERLFRQGVAQGLEVERLTSDSIREREPHVRATAAIWVPSTAIVDFLEVTRRLAELVRGAGGAVRTSTAVGGLLRSRDRWVVTTPAGDLDALVVVNCAGLQSDRVARLAGAEPGVRIVPFRGEYYDLVPEKRHLVRGLIYPVPHPALPFLGVHLTRMVGGGVHAGPNAVLGLHREGYQRREVDIRDTWDVLSYGGAWRLARRYWKVGAEEVYRSVFKAAFVRSLQRLVPGLHRGDLTRSTAGVRAQAVAADGRLVDDFLFVEEPGAVHVCNAPSPAATASLEIGRIVADRVIAGPLG